MDDAFVVTHMSTADDDLSPQRERAVTSARAPWRGRAQRRCRSLTCRLVDVGVWLDEAYRVPLDEDGDVS